MNKWILSVLVILLLITSWRIITLSLNHMFKWNCWGERRCWGTYLLVQTLFVFEHALWALTSILQTYSLVWSSREAGSAGFNWLRVMNFLCSDNFQGFCHSSLHEFYVDLLAVSYSSQRGFIFSVCSEWRDR